MVDIDATAQIVACLVYRPKAQLLLAANTGRGFAAEADELLAETRKGRGVMTTKEGVKLTVVREIAERDVYKRQIWSMRSRPSPRARCPICATG